MLVTTTVNNNSNNQSESIIKLQILKNLDLMFFKNFCFLTQKKVYQVVYPNTIIKVKLPVSLIRCHCQLSF